MNVGKLIVELRRWKGGIAYHRPVQNMLLDSLAALEELTVTPTTEETKQ